jgi:cystathionine beta-lyase/cystathionine gamma-synthase
MESSRLVYSLTKNVISADDVVGAFINGKLDHEIYMAQPSGFEDISRSDYVMLLLRNLYGLEQA